MFILLYRWLLKSIISEVFISKLEFEILVDRKLSKVLKYMSLKLINIFSFLVFINLLFFCVPGKLSEAFSTNKCGFGNGLYEILPDVLR